MSAVDVRAVLKKEADYSGCLGPRAAEARTKRLLQVHAAVAELVEAGQRALALLDDEDLGDYRSAEMLRAALARVGGGK